MNLDFVYKIERNGCRSKYYVIRKFLRHKQPQNFHIEDSNLGIVSNLLSYPDATVSCDRFNRELVYVNTADGWRVVSGQNTNLPPDVPQPL